jgi:hypothetical protein
MSGCRCRLLLATLILLAACRPTVDPNLFRGEAVVIRGVDACAVALSIDGETYEPANLPSAHAVVGLRIMVEGVVFFNRISACMMGPGLDIRSSTILE